MIKKTSTLFTRLFLGTCLLGGVATAETAKSINLKIESIECRDRQKELIKSDKIVIHDSIRSLKPKLKKLPYKSYHLDSVEKITLPDHQRHEIKLKNGDVLALELLYFDKQRIGLELDWRDSTNMKLLETRMHFDQDDTMLAGAADEESMQAKMLAISLQDVAAKKE